MAELPLEIIQHILSDAAQGSNIVARFENLRSLSHVHRSLTPYVQKLLFTDVSLDCSESLALFLETIEGEKLELKGWVKSLRIGSWDDVFEDETTPLLKRLLGACSEVETIQLDEIWNVNFAIFARAKSQSLYLEPQLRPADHFLVELHTPKAQSLCNAHFRPDAGEIESLLALRNLTVTLHSEYDSTLENNSFFTPDVLPSLQRLIFAPYSTVPNMYRFDYPLSSLEDLNPLASQLRHLSLPMWVNDLTRLLPHFHNLVTLEFDCNHLLPTIPVTKPLLGLRLLCDAPEQRERYRGRSPLNVLQNALLRGFIDPSRSTVFMVMEEEDLEEMAEVREWARSIGLRLEYSDGELESVRRQQKDGGALDFAEWGEKEYEKRLAAVRSKAKEE